MTKPNLQQPTLAGVAAFVSAITARAFADHAKGIEKYPTGSELLMTYASAGRTFQRGMASGLYEKIRLSLEAAEKDPHQRNKQK